MSPKMKSKRGFTFVEMVVVVAVLGILVLLAAPKFLGNTYEAHVAHIKADIKTLETEIQAQSIENVDLSEEWVIKPKEQVEIASKNELLFNKRGIVYEEKLIDQDYLEIDYKQLKFKTSLPGEFVLSKGGDVYYLDKNNGVKVVTIKKPESPQKESESPQPKGPTPYTEEQKKTLAEESEFVWVQDPNAYYSSYQGNTGYYWYAGNKKVVTIPEKMNGEVLTSYYLMFAQTSVEKVISNNNTVIDLTGTFSSSKAPNLDLSEFDTSSVRGMYSTFMNSAAKTINVSNWDTSKVEDMSGTFYQAQATTVDVSKWDTSSLKTMYSTFYSSGITTLDVSKWDTSKVTNMRSTFYGVPATTLDVSNFDVSKVETMYALFYNTKTTTLDVGKWDTSNVQDMSYMFYGSTAKTIPLENFKTSNVETLRSTFYGSNVQKIDISKWDTSNVTDFSSMFMMSGATEINTSGIDTSSATDMFAMFSEVKDTTLDVSSFDISNVKDIGHMFSYNPNLATLDLTSFGDFSKVESKSMFQYSGLQNVYVENNTFINTLKTKHGLNVFKTK